MLNERRFKLVVLGTTGVGKTCLTLRFVKGLFDEEQLPTIGAAYMTKRISLPRPAKSEDVSTQSTSGSLNSQAGKAKESGNNEKDASNASNMKDKEAKNEVSGEFVVEIWDTAGQERYEAITPLYYRSAEAAIIAFDLTSKHSFNKAKEWLKRLRKERPDPSMPIVLAGNKQDLKAKIEEETKSSGKMIQGFELVSDEEINDFVKENKLKFFKTSAKTGEHIEDIFYYLASNLPQKKESKREVVFPVNNNTDQIRAGCC